MASLLTFYTFALAVMGVVFVAVIADINLVLAIVVGFIYFISVALIMLRAYKIRKREIAKESERIRQEKLLRQEEMRKKALLAEEEAKTLAEKRKSEKMVIAENLVTAGRYEEAARFYDEFEMYGKAGECRRMEKTSYQISTVFNMGKDGTISVNCPNCGSSHAIESKTNLVKCNHCGNKYIIPKKVLDMM